MTSIYQNWIKAKEDEAAAIARRRFLEDEMVHQLAFDLSSDGTTTYKADGYTIKVTGRINRTIDGDKLQEIAFENGLSDHLHSLFRWKPELNMSAWKAADQSITSPLREAITAKNGRPSFSIVPKE